MCGWCCLDPLLLLIGICLLLTPGPANRLSRLYTLLAGFMLLLPLPMTIQFHLVKHLIATHLGSHYADGLEMWDGVIDVAIPLFFFCLALLLLFLATASRHEPGWDD